MKPDLNSGQKKTLLRILAAAALLAAAYAVTTLIPLEGPARLIIYLVPYLLAGGDILLTAVRNIGHGRVFDENFLMSVATIGAFALGEYPEAVFVMLFYQVGELFQRYAVNRSRKSIADLMNISPDSANVERGGEVLAVSPDEVSVGETIVVRPGERVPLDGIVVEGASELDTAALTGESVPRAACEGEEVISGCINLTGLLRVRVTKVFSDSTVSRILELVENAASKKAKTENFITSFAHWYTPLVVTAALTVAVLPPLVLGQPFADWVFRALIFLVVSCPCALVISVPLGFFGGIGAASRHGILVKGSNYLEALSKADTIAFDKTGTITTGSFTVRADSPEVLELAAYAESASTHPISRSIRAAYGKGIDQSRVKNIVETGGQGISAEIDGHAVLAGNVRLMIHHAVGMPADLVHAAGSVVYIARDGKYAGAVYLEDTLKPEAKAAIAELSRMGISHTVLLTGDREEAAARVASEAGIHSYRAGLLPQDKVAAVEELLADSARLVYVGDGINDAPVLARADIGVAMGALGSDAAIEAADIVLMDDSLAKIPQAVRLSKKTLGVVKQNIVFALVVKAGVLVLAMFGLATMWEAIFADVGVAVLAILNAMRMLRA
ncbi:MAG: heavy metal translocating P-type ATPase [Methanocorpusculum sp.]|nr:heavy metal translocating P-type ATPase [Methanocorpusculum sp.]